MAKPIDMEALNAASRHTITEPLGELYDDVGQGTWDLANYIGDNVYGGINSLASIPQYGMDWIEENRARDIYAPERKQNNNWSEYIQNQKIAKQNAIDQDSRMARNLTRQPRRFNNSQNPVKAEVGAKAYGSYIPRASTPTQPQPQPLTQQQRMLNTNAFSPEEANRAYADKTFNQPTQREVLDQQLNSDVKGTKVVAPARAFLGPRDAPRSMLENRSNLTADDVTANKAAFAAMYPDYKVDRTWETQGATDKSRLYNKAGYVDPTNMRNLTMQNAAMGLINMKQDPAELRRMGLGTPASAPVRQVQQVQQTQPVRQAQSDPRLPSTNISGRLPYRDTDWNYRTRVAADANLAGTPTPYPPHPSALVSENDKFGAGISAPPTAQVKPNLKQMGLVENPLGYQANNLDNQTSGSQINNNGNINNPKMLNNPKANRNGFF